jgi:hypothetical protein
VTRLLTSLMPTMLLLLPWRLMHEFDFSNFLEIH